MNGTPQIFHGSGKIPAWENAVELMDMEEIHPSAKIHISRFTGNDGTTEFHITVCLTSGTGSTAELEEAWLAALAAAELPPSSTLLRRVFVPANTTQADLVGFANAHPGSFSVIGQHPLASDHPAIWSHHLTDTSGPLISLGGGSSFCCIRGPLHHCWLVGISDPSGHDAFSETLGVLEKHNAWLTRHGMSLSSNVVRTWWFIRDIDADYQGLVKARREVFAHHNLTDSTHYIASTGIGGTLPGANARLSLDSYAIHGLLPQQIEFLSAPRHLGPTHQYGVTFERATALTYKDRRHILISGTASIDINGAIVHPGDVIRQLERTLENITALLASADATQEDLAMILVYLRNPEDGKVVEAELTRRFRNLPMVLLHAPVCRPGWLIEIEGVATVATQRPDLPAF